MTTAALARLLPLAPARLGLPARVSCALALAALVGACAQPQPDGTYAPRNYSAAAPETCAPVNFDVRPLSFNEWAQCPELQRAFRAYLAQREDINRGPAALKNPPAQPSAPAPSTSGPSIFSPVSPAEAAEPTPAPQASVPAAAPADPSNRSPTCGYWRLGCGILWQ